MLIFLAIILFLSFFFFNDTATTEIYTLSLHDALPISSGAPRLNSSSCSLFNPTAFLPDRHLRWASSARSSLTKCSARRRSEEHTSELQSQSNLVCRLLLEKKKQKTK